MHNVMNIELMIYLQSQHIMNLANMMNLTDQYIMYIMEMELGVYLQQGEHIMILADRYILDVNMIML